MPNVNNFAFTFFNYTEDDESRIDKWLTDHPGQVKYLEYGHEECPTTKKPHLQGFISFVERLSKKAVINIFKNLTGKEVTVKACKGSAISNCTYVTKERTDIYKYGEVPVLSTPEIMNENKKRKYEEIIKLSEERNIKKLKLEYPREFLQHYNKIISISNNVEPVKDNLTEVSGILIYGESGSGKTTMVRTQYTNLYLKDKKRWDTWDNYHGQENVLIDDITPSFMTKYWEDFLTILDIFPFPAKILYGQLESIRPKNVILTSNYTIEQLLYAVPYQSQTAVRRRFKEIKEKKKDF